MPQEIWDINHGELHWKDLNIVDVSVENYEKEEMNKNDQKLKLQDEPIF